VYEITPERQAYLEAHGHVILSACPGSGKTTSIVQKLLAVSNYCESRYGKHTGFACLSFTNKACDELKEKYREQHDERLSFPNVVSTIDSFIMQTVVSPFWYLCEGCKMKPIVVNEGEVLNRVYFNNVFQNGVWNTFLSPALKPYKDLFFSKDPHKVTREKNGYNWNHNPVTEERDTAYCEEVFKYRLSKGFITSSDALWIACDILNNHPKVARAIVKRYPYIIVDEAQDNSELHFVFFGFLKDAGLENLEYVGDVCQSIYGFRDARPELLQGLMKEKEWTVLPLTECRRSNQRIIDFYSKLKPKGLPTIRSHGVVDQGIPIMVYRYDSGNVRDIIQDFYQVCDKERLNSKIVLARGTDKCKQLAGVKDLNFRYWKSEMPYILIDAVFAYSAGEMDLAFRKIRLILAELFGGDSPDSQRDYVHKIESDIDINAKIFRFLQQIPSFSLSFNSWSDQTAQLMQKYWTLNEKPVFEAYSRKKGYVMREMAEAPLEQYHRSNDRNSDYHNSVDTIHAVKGATLDAVLLFLSKDSRGQSISLNDFLQGKNAIMTESQRLIYVACSRARQFLAIAVPDTIRDEEIHAALAGIKVEIRDVGLQRVLAFE